MPGFIQPNRSARHTDQPLTNISIAFFQSAEDFVASRVFPIVPVAKSTDFYYEIPRGYFNRNEVKKRARGSKPEIMNHEFTRETFDCEVYALGSITTDEDEVDTDEIIRDETIQSDGLTQQGLINRETDFMRTFMSATSGWTATYAGVASSPGANQFLRWSDDTSDPIADVELQKTAMKQRTGYSPNTFTLGYQVYAALRNHPDIVDRVKYGQTSGGPALVTPNVLAQVFGIDRILISGGIQNTALEGQDDVHDFINGDSALLTYSAPTPSRRAPSAGYTFAWNIFSPTGMRLRRHRLDVELADLIVMDDAFDQKQVSTDLGAFFGSAV